MTPPVGSGLESSTSDMSKVDVASEEPLVQWDGDGRRACLAYARRSTVTERAWQTRRPNVDAGQRRILRKDCLLALVGREVIEDDVDRDSRTAHGGLPALASRASTVMCSRQSIGFSEGLPRNLAVPDLVRLTPQLTCKGINKMRAQRATITPLSGAAYVR